MFLKALCKLAATTLLGAALAGCIDADVDVELLSATTARATITQVMGADFYAMIKMNAEGSKGQSEPEEFCATGALTENSDGTATCIIVEEGRFADLTLGAKQEIVQFTPAGRGLVRVSLRTARMKAEIGADEAMDDETRKMVEAFFAGRGATVRFSGLEITDTNMDLSSDGRSAQQKIQFLDLLRGTADLPEEVYAVVRVAR